MTLQDKIARIRQLDKDLIPEAMEDAKRCLTIATGLTASVSSDGGKNPCPGNSMERRMADYAAANAKVDKLIDELYDLRCEVACKINQAFADDKLRRFAKLYYADLMSQHRIAKETHYEYGTVRNCMVDIRKAITSNDIK